jgi:hypothetical protein
VSVFFCHKHKFPFYIAKISGQRVQIKCEWYVRFGSQKLTQVVSLQVVLQQHEHDSGVQLRLPTLSDIQMIEKWECSSP